MSDEEEYKKQLEIQRRNFEAQFGSIEDLGFEDKSKGKSSESESENNSESESETSESDFEGFDPASEINEPKVIKLNDSYTPTPTISKRDKKILKYGKIPTVEEIDKREKLAESKKPKTNEDNDENLQNDLKLQKLLKESHILTNTLEYSGADLTLQTIDFDDPTGKARRRTLDSRFEELSSTNGVRPKTLEKMPMNMRKGMIKKRNEKISKYEKEAKDAGIVISKVRKGELRDLSAGRGSTSSSDRLGSGKKIKKTNRDKGLKIHGIGKSTRNGLVISQNDITRINSNKKYNRR
ncbi:unnamed protein product [Candida verbasci]|uniref:Protein FAF1 n=1 Tax=Candida verbasci TaxID=1227364 RepID=A0A9W4XB75_9ASCO|nr:unnamed protein product [Candida verbasci]